MENIQLRQLIRESIQEYIREVETSGNIAAQEAKIKACEEAIALREKKANLDGLDEAYHDMMDSTKLNELKKEIKELQKYKTKAEKVLEKMKAKAEGKVTKKVEDEGMEEGVVDEVNIDEYTSDPESGPQLEENKINENSAYNRIVRKMEAEISPETRAEANRLSSRGEMDYAVFWNELSNETKADIADLYIDTFDEGFDSFEEVINSDNAEWFEGLFNSLINMDDEDDDDYLNEAQMLHMQKLAGIISETEYKKRINEAASKMQLFKSLDKKNLNNEKLNDLNYVKKLIDDILDKEYDTVADNPEALAKEYINSRKNKIEEAKKKPSAGLTKKQKSAVSKKAHAGKDIGKKGKGFEKVAKAAEKQYGSKEAGERVAAAAMWKSIKRK